MFTELHKAETDIASVLPDTACVHLLATEAQESEASAGVNQELGIQESLAFPYALGFFFHGFAFHW